jgi:hypothetical protein
MNTDIVQLFLALPAPVQNIALAFLILSYLASLFVSKTETPPPDTSWGRAYRLIEFLAGIFGKAKQSPPANGDSHDA